MDRLLVLFVAAMACVASAQEQGTPAKTPNPPEDPMVARMMAQAARPGDKALTCDQLMAEIGALKTDTQVQTVIQEQGVYAQEKMAKVQGAQQQAETAKATQPSIAGQMVKGFLSSFIPPNPVTARAQQAAAEAKNAQAMVESEKNVKDMMASVQEVAGITPKLMRSAHVVKLAEAKGCDFVAGERPPGQ